ncbi:MAG TPA: sigma-70 family RNA polymerase sigma factor [Polyangiaceae bacterium]|nr:sigma-70 family RNA polymerase sigma factor [Polyangiaceae bacterium]
MTRPESHVDRLASFELIYRQHFAFAWRSLRRLGICERDLNDAAQDVFLVVYRKLPEFDFEHPIGTWIYAICLRVASSRRRSAVQRHEQLGDAPEPLEKLEPALAADAETQQLSERRALLAAALDAMSLEQRAVFTLFELEGRTGEEVAELLGVPAPTVASRLRLAREIFRRSIERHRAREHFELRRMGGER